MKKIGESFFSLFDLGQKKILGDPMLSKKILGDPMLSKKKIGGSKSEKKLSPIFFIFFSKKIGKSFFSLLKKKFSKSPKLFFLA
jgi:hypothetical protein